MIGIHQSVARSVRMAAIRRAVFVVGGFLLLGGIGITAGIAQAKGNNPERTVTPSVKTETPSDIPPPTYNGPAATATKETSDPDAEVESATTTSPPATPPPTKTNTGNVIRTENPPPPAGPDPVEEPKPEPTPDPAPVVTDPEPTDPNL